MASRQLRVVRRAMEDFAASAVVRVIRTLVVILAGEPDQGGTPRDTQWASSNWIAQIGSPFDGTVGSKENVSRAQQEAGLLSLSLYRLHGGNLWVTNNVDYVEKLNNGSSRQAPAGFVQNAIVRADLARLGGR